MRPLSAAQLSYALNDVRHLHRLQADLTARVAALNRQAWMAEEMEALLAVGTALAVGWAVAVAPASC